MAEQKTNLTDEQLTQELRKSKGGKLGGKILSALGVVIAAAGLILGGNIVLVVIGGVIGRKSTKCNTFVKEDLSRRSPTKAFPRSGVDQRHDRVYVLLRDGPEITALGEEKAQEAVGVLVRPTLPRLVRLSKVDHGVQRLLQGPELGELRAIVQADAMDRKALEHPADHCLRQLRLASLQQSRSQETALPVHLRHEEPLPCGSIHRIALPVADPRALADLLRPLRDDTVRLDAVIVGTLGQTAFSSASQVRFRLDPREELLSDIAVDGRDTERFPIGMLQVPAACDRLRRPVALQTDNDEVPCFRAGAQRRAAMVPATPDGEVLCPPVVVPIRIVRLLVRSPLRSVPLHLTADRRGAALQGGRDLSQTEAFPQKLL